MGKLRDLLEQASRHVYGVPDSPQPVAAPTEARGWVTSGGGRFWLGSSDSYPLDGGEGPVTDSLRSVAHWAARRVLCTSIAGLPVQQVRETRDAREVMTPSQIVRRPAQSVKRKQWVYQVMDAWLDDGNAYGDVLDVDSRGFPLIVETRSPSTVKWDDSSGVLRPYTNGVQRSLWPLGDLWHEPCFVRAGSPIGLSPSMVAAQSVATSVAAEKFGGDYFHAGGLPVSDIEIADPNATDAQVEAIKARARAATRNREPFAHTPSIKWTFPPSNMDTKFVELLRFECEQAARIYGVPPIMIYAAVSGSSVTYANATQEDLAFLKHSLRWWVNLLQDAWSEFLPAPQVVRLNVDAFLQMTARERAEVHEIRLRTKTRTVNEVRKIEDEPSFSGEQYDQPGIPADAAPPEVQSDPTD